jgi:hypothetical protein
MAIISIIQKVGTPNQSKNGTKQVARLLSMQPKLHETSHIYEKLRGASVRKINQLIYIKKNGEDSEEKKPILGVQRAQLQEIYELLYQDYPVSRLTHEEKANPVITLRELIFRPLLTMQLSNCIQEVARLFGDAVYTEFPKFRQFATREKCKLLCNKSHQ